MKFKKFPLIIFSTVEFLLILIGVMIEFFIEYHNSNIKIRSKEKDVPPHHSEIEKKFIQIHFVMHIVPPSNIKNKSSMPD